MPFVTITDGIIEITEEVILCKPMYDLFKKDRTKDKSNFMRQIGIIYYMYDPRSAYSYITDEDERLRVVLEEEGYDDTFDMKSLESIIEVYKRHVETTSSLLLKSLRNNVEKIRKRLDDMDYSKAETLKEEISAMKDAMTMTKMIPDLLETLKKTEKQVNLDIQEKSRAKGGNESKSMFEDGIQ